MNSTGASEFGISAEYSTRFNAKQSFSVPPGVSRPHQLQSTTRHDHNVMYGGNAPGVMMPPNVASDIDHLPSSLNPNPHCGQPLNSPHCSSSFSGSDNAAEFALSHTPDLNSSPPFTALLSALTKLEQQGSQTSMASSSSQQSNMVSISSTNGQSFGSFKNTPFSSSLSHSPSPPPPSSTAFSSSPKKTDRPFLVKLWDILQTPSYKHIINWSDDGGSIVVFDPHKFEQEVFPKYFKATRFSSFTRQLNMYRFKKCGNHWSHPNFLRGQKHLLSQISRQAISARTSTKNVSTTTSSSNLSFTSLSTPHFSVSPPIQLTPQIPQKRHLPADNKIPPFLNHLYEIVDNEKWDTIVSWTEDGLSLKVNNPRQLETVVLSKYFKHSSFSSFNRQLNMYSFSKCGVQQWNNPNFMKGRRDLLGKIVRKRPKITASNSLNNDAQKEIDFLKKLVGVEQKARQDAQRNAETLRAELAAERNLRERTEATLRHIIAQLAALQVILGANANPQTSSLSPNSSSLQVVNNNSNSLTSLNHQSSFVATTTPQTLISNQQLAIGSLNSSSVRPVSSVPMQMKTESPLNPAITNWPSYQMVNSEQHS